MIFFIFWERSMTDFTYFESVSNSLYADIQFKVQKSTEKLPFLDIMVVKHGNSIITDIYFKSTDSKEYLNFNYCHPKATKNKHSILTCTYNLNNCFCFKSTENTPTRSRKYPNEVIKTSILKSIHIPRNTLHTERGRNKHYSIYYYI